MEGVVEKGCSLFVMHVDDNVDVEPIENVTHEDMMHNIIHRKVGMSS